MSLYIFARFEPREGKRDELLNALRAVVEPTRDEPGCLSIGIYESIREPLSYFIHSEFRDEAAFELHATLPHTVRFLETVPDLISNSFHAERTRLLPTNIPG